jgi:hypothetical protein
MLAALLAAGTAAALVAAGAAAAALVAAAALDGVALPADFVLAHPATNNAAIPRKTVALIAGDVARTEFFILKLLHVCGYSLPRLVGGEAAASTTARGDVPFNAAGRRCAGGHVKGP